MFSYMDWEGEQTPPPSFLLLAAASPIVTLLHRIGSFYAFILSRSEKVRLSVVARSNYDAVKAKGLTLNSENHGSHHVTPYQGASFPGYIHDAWHGRY